MRVTGVAMAAGLLVAAVGAAAAVRAATRLDWLHVRTDAARAALDAALCRRALVVDGLGTGPGAATAQVAAGAGGALRSGLHGGHTALRAGAHTALRAGAATREEVENELSGLLAMLDRAGLDPACAGRLADAEQRVVIARRVYNDAVRDTLALRTHRTVRWFRLAGTAPIPRYFEIAEPPLDQLVSE